MTSTKLPVSIRIKIKIGNNDVEIGNLDSDNHQIVMWVEDSLFFFFVEGNGLPLNLWYLLVPVAFDAENLGILGCSDLLFPRAVGYAY